MIARAFPTPPRLLRHAYEELVLARSGTAEQKKALGPVGALARPWDPPSCPATLRAHLWVWLDDVAEWVNQEYSWQVDRLIPSCWPAHRHIVHELAVLADLRYSAGRALTGSDLEEWHRYALPSFLERLTARLGQTCGPGKHTEWPAVPRHREYTSEAARAWRVKAFAADTAPGRQPQPDPALVEEQVGRGPALALVDPSTGEVLTPRRGAER